MKFYEQTSKSSSVTPSTNTKQESSTKAMQQPPTIGQSQSSKSKSVPSDSNAKHTKSSAAMQQLVDDIP